MGVTNTEVKAPVGSIGPQARVRYAAFDIVVVPVTSQGGGGGPVGGGYLSGATPAPGERVDAKERPDPGHSR
jgi:hypothetical protein